MQEHAISAKVEALIPMPKHYCKDCTKCIKSGGNFIDNLIRVINCHCTFFNRRVEPDYNKCFNHSNYKPVHSIYKSPENIVEIALENERKQSA